MNNNPEEKRYLTPFIAWLNLLGNHEADISRFFKQVSQLPVGIQNILKGFATAEFIEDKIAPKFNLDSEQTKDLVLVMKDILMGKLSLEDTPENISSSLQIGSKDGEDISKIIISELFQPAIEDIRNLRPASAPPSVPSRPVPVPQRPAPVPPPQRIPPPQPLSTLGGVNPNNVVDLRNKNNN